MPELVIFGCDGVSELILARVLDAGLRAIGCRRVSARMPDLATYPAGTPCA
jgi:hypothetical protein